MKNLTALIALFGMTTGMAAAAGNPFLDWDRIESEVSPTGYVADSGTSVMRRHHDFADWDRVESELHPTGRGLGSFAAGERVYDHPGVGDSNPAAAQIGNIEYSN